MGNRPRSLLQPGLSVTIDLVFINLSVVLAYYIRYQLQWFRDVDPAFDASLGVYFPFALGLSALSFATFWIAGVYRPHRGISWFDEMYPILNGVTTSIAALVFVTFFARPLAFSRLLFFYTWVLELALLGAARLARRIVEAHLRARGHNVAHVLIVGAGEVGRAAMRQIIARPALGYRLVGYLDDAAARNGNVQGRLQWLGKLEDIESVLAARPVDEVIIALPWTYSSKIMALVRICERRGVTVRVVPDLFQFSLSRVDVDDLGGIPLIGVKEVPILSPSGRLAKRLLDLTVSSIGGILATPLFLLLALLIRLDTPGAAIFRQTRVGQKGRPFRVFKFRSMYDGADRDQAHLEPFNEASGPLFKIRDDPRVTRVGRFLRRFSLDELPQIINVLRGEMSLVGPRPALPDEVERYEPWQRQRLDVAPGLTGLWQVSGRSDISFEEMCLLDIYYSENWSLGLDISILLRTLPTVLLGRGAY